MEIYRDVIGPILCSIIGGAFTVWGVYLTINYEKRKNNEKEKLSNKPLFYRIDPMQEYDYQNSIDYYMCENTKDTQYKLYGIFKNTENALIILDYVTVNNKKYFPRYGNVIDKNKIVNLYVFIDDNLKTNDEVILSIKDVLDNQYEYRIEFEVDYNKNSSLIKGFSEIVQ